ncbi:uncharacterized protein LOC122957212 [Acropora millepora]|uniref:uncharacterized protein LOC122957212 n=1 Tax=Acropora millepora TaxID=45264 RepID=UPI001CF36B5F|nr:uncharacterized protein LOC122957212 [Acropora millepora]
MKDWLESLHGKFEVIFNMMSAIEARLAAIEAGICLVPFSLQDPRTEHAENNDLTAQLPIHSASPQSLMQNESINKSTSSTTATSSTSVQFFQPDSSTLNNTQSTPMTPTHRPQTLPSISPIVSNLLKETASKLKMCHKKVSSRKKYIRKCLEEIFSTEEKASSNISGNAGKDKLDQYKIGLINRLVIAAFPPIPTVENSEDVAREIARTINLKCRELKKSNSKRCQQTSAPPTV